MSSDIVVETDLEATPDAVWRALTEPEFTDQWLGAREIGADTQILESEPERRLRIAWRAGEGAGAHQSEVSFTLTEISTGTRLKIVHGNFTPVRAALRRAVSQYGDFKWAA